MCQSIGSMERVCEGVVETYTPRGHVVGMLDRDQRTAKVPTYQNHAILTSASAVTTAGSSSSTSSASAAEEQVCRGKVHSTWNSRGWKSRVRDTAQRLKQVLVVSTCLFSIVSIPGSLSAPYAMEDRMNSPQKWIVDLDCLHTDQTPIDDTDHRNSLLDTIIGQAKIALSHATSFKPNYANKTQLNQMQYTNWRYDFLPTVSSPRDERKDLRESLIDTYERLQRIAVALEEVTWGEYDNPSDHQEMNFYTQFKDAETNLKNLLYEIAIVICELGFKESMRPNVTRSAMPTKFRNLPDVTSRYPRDWSIYSELMKHLDHTIALFKELKNSEDGSASGSRIEEYS